MVDKHPLPPLCGVLPLGKGEIKSFPFQGKVSACRLSEGSYRKRPAYLLIETLLALLILAILIIPWTQFLQVHRPDDMRQEITLFFQTKKYFLQALSQEMPPTITMNKTIFSIEKIPLRNDLKQLRVDCRVNGHLRYSLVGVTR